MWNKSRVGRPAVGALSVLLILGVGCRQTKKGSQEPTAVQPAQSPAAPAQAPDDQQLLSAVQAKIGSEPALHGQDIQIGVANGVVTLSGAARNPASRALASAESGSVAGIRTVINDLTVGPAVAVSKAAPPRKPEYQKPERQKTRAARPAYHEPAAAANAETAQEMPPPAPPAPAAPAPPEQVQTVAPPPPPPPPTPKTVTLSAGTVIPVRMTDALDSATTQSDTVFHGALAANLIVDGMIAAPRGASVVGRVITAKNAGHFSGSSELTLELTTLYAGKQHVSLITDQYTKKGAGRGKNTAVKSGMGAALGGLIGAMAGGGEGAAIGAAAGGGVGAGSNGVKRGEQVQIPSETIVNFRLQSPVSMRTSRVANGSPSYSPEAGPQLRNGPPPGQPDQPSQ